MIFEKFKKLSDDYNIIPVYKKITADLLTPVSAFIRLRNEDKFCFLFESVEGLERFARYSFIGRDPKKIIKNYGENISVVEDGIEKQFQGNIFSFLKSELHKKKYPVIDELPDLTGGIIGYLGYENAAQIENVIEFDGTDNLDKPDSVFGVFNTLIVFDHYKHQIILITNIDCSKFDTVEEAYDSADSVLNNLSKILAEPSVFNSSFKLNDSVYENFNVEDFYNDVQLSKKNIYDGDIFQLVLSRRFQSNYEGDLLNVYRALRIINPSPYMYFIQLDNNHTIIGTSPEDLIKVKNKKAAILPIAGTRKRGRNKEEDARLESELLNDPKELAEHRMLVDLARNDLGRVCKYNSVTVTDKMTVSKFSHVMHIVSRVEGELSEDKDCIDALTASFPAGTVSGAPKIKAIQLINIYEKLKRNVYAGAVGYIDYKGNMDMCIAIRTLFADSEKIYWQAGAGIVADSVPELELKEIRNKSEALLSALKQAEVINENIDY